MARWTITTLIQGGTWPIFTPPIKELRALASEDNRGKLEVPPELAKLFYRRNVVVIQRDGRTIDEQGFSRSHESTASLERYVVWTKARAFNDVNYITERVRDILINQSTGGTYSHFEIKFEEDVPDLGRWTQVLSITAHLVGKAIVNTFTEQYNEEFPYPNGTSPDTITFSQAWGIAFQPSPGSFIIEVQSQELKIRDAQLNARMLIDLPPWTVRTDQYKFTFRVDPDDMAVASDEWEFQFKDAYQGNTLVTVYLHFTTTGWGWRWSTGNDGYTRAIETNTTVDFRLSNNKIALIIDENELVFENVPYDTDGIVKGLRLSTPRASSELYCTCYMDDLLVRTIPTAYLEVYM